MTLHKRDFNALAQAAHMTISNLREQAQEEQRAGNEYGVHEYVAQGQGYAEAMRDFAEEVAARHNDQFDRIRFYRACGLDDMGFFTIGDDHG